MQFNTLVGLIERYPVYSIMISFGLFLLLLLILLAFALQKRKVNRRLAKLEKEYMSLKSIENLDPQNLSPKLDRIEKKFSSLLQHVAMVRFNAFDNVGNGLSFALAVLNDRGDGFVISSLYGGEETRTYAKQIVGGKSSHPLSPEEEEAVIKAMEQK